MKTKGLILVIFLSLAAGGLNAQTYSLLVPDKIIDNFFISLSKDLPHRIVKINQDIIEWNERDIYGEQDTLYQMGELTMGIMEIDTVRSFFTDKDLKYVEKQFNNLDGDTWYADHFRKFEVIDSVGLNKIMSHSYSEKKMGKNYSYTFSIPLFSLNMEYAIVQQEFDCGYECSTYCIYIYKQSADKKSWDKVTSWKCISAGDKARE